MNIEKTNNPLPLGGDAARQKGALKHEEVKPYREGGTKREQVEEMFDNIAPTYDRLNHSMAWSIDRWWRRRALVKYRVESIENRVESIEYRVESIENKAALSTLDSRLLDIATGTGDLAIDAVELLKPSKVDATDISEGMMAIGKKKIAALGYEDIVSFRRDDVMNLSAEDNTYDGVISAYGLRNFPDLKQSFSEMHRVVKEGGAVCLIELSRPRWFPMRQLFWLYSHTVMPLIGWIMSRDIKAYKYLVKTIEAFPQAERIDEMLLEAGFKTVEHHRMTFGICTYFIASK